MRSISKLFSAALILILAAACNTKEIDNPDNPDKPKAYDNIILTAGINQTRVDYSVVGSKLVPGWVEGDVIFGYFGSGDGSQIEFTVDDVKEDGTAVLEPGKGWDDFLQQFKSLEDGETLPIGLIYTGSEASYSLENPNDVIVSMTPQTGVNIPACMHASQYKKDKDDEAQIIRFLFDNDCAIFEIESLTGIAEDAGLTDGQTLSLTSLTVTNLIPTYEYSYASGELSYNSGTGDPTSYTINLPEDAWEVDYEGNINHSADKNLLVAVAPNSENNILITATTEGGRQFSYLYNGELVGGQCYIIRKRDVVAKTEDDQYFTSVSGAFAHAAVLSGQGYTTAEDNVVTLIKKEIDGFGEQTALPTHTSTIEIDYPVTLDLNGCTLSLDEIEEFYVELFTGEITIQDGTDEDNQVKYDGTISSTSGNPILWNCGTVNIHGGNLIYDGDNNLIHNLGTVNISDGFLKSYAESDEEIDEYYSVVHNEATLNIYSGTLNSVNCDTIINNGTATISGGEVDSKNGYAIKSLGGILTITGGSIFSTNQSAIICDGGSIDIDGEDLEIKTNATTDISGYNIPAIVIKTEGQKNASFDMDSGYIFGSNGAIVFDGNVRADISGGLIESNVGTTVEVKNGGGGYYETAESTPVPNCTISGGTIGRKTSSETGYSLNILAGSSCKISGGIIYNLCTSGTQGGAISCYTNTKGDGTSLTVEWPKDGSGNDITSLGEPLIYSSGADVDATPIEANKFSNDIDYALIYLNGGYLYHNRKSSTCFFSCDNINDEHSSNIASFGEVYSNTNAFRYSGTRSTINQFFSGITLNDGSTRSLSSQTLSGEAIVNISTSFIGDIQFKYRIY